MPFDSYSLKEQALQIIKDADAEGTLRHGYYAYRARSERTGRLLKRLEPGCAVGHLAVAAVKAGHAYMADTGSLVTAFDAVGDHFGLDFGEIADIEQAFETVGELSEAAASALAKIRSIKVKED